MVMIARYLGLGFLFICMICGPVTAHAGSLLSAFCSANARNGTLITNVLGTASSFFLGIDNLVISGSVPPAFIIPVTLNWTSPQGAAMSMTAQNVQAITVSLKGGTSLTYSCLGSNQGIIRFAAGAHGVDFPSAWDSTTPGYSGATSIPIQCSYSTSGPVFQELAGFSGNVFVHITNPGDIAMPVSYTDGSGNTVGGSVPAKTTWALSFLLGAESKFAFGCPNQGVGGEFGFELTNPSLP